MNRNLVTQFYKWPRLAAPVYPADTQLRMQAQSVLHGLVRDPLPDTAEQARDVLSWAARRYAAEQSPGIEYETELQEGFFLKYGLTQQAR